MNIFSFSKSPNSPFNTHGGVKVPHRKNTANLKSTIMPPPQNIILPMVQHIGAPCVPIVAVGDTVKLGQLVAVSNSVVSAPIHSSVSGTVSKIEKILMPNGACVDAIFIESDGKMTPFEDIKPHKVKNKEDIVESAKNCGLVGLGGAGFPAHVKLNIPKGKIVDTFIINAAECEPYITSDNRAIIEETARIVDGVKLILNTLNIKKAVIGIESNKPQAIKCLNNALSGIDNISVLILKSKYPQGAEKVLIKSVTGREVPLGKLPIDVGCIVMNVVSVLTLFNYIKTGMPLVSKRITVDGSVIAEPKNLIVPIGTPISEVIRFCGGYKAEPKKILMGGPMMGIALIDDSFPILKQNNAILAFGEAEAKILEPSACIRCGRCVENCPMKLMPTLLEQNVQYQNIDALNKLSVTNCMECGCCSYNCPAFRPLVQSIRLGKNLVKVKR